MATSVESWIEKTKVILMAQCNDVVVNTKLALEGERGVLSDSSLEQAQNNTVVTLSDKSGPGGI